MIEIPSEAEIGCPAEVIFDVITDLEGQGRWLANTFVFRGTVDMSDSPAVLGTSYREPGPLGVRNGRVVELDRPTREAFHQPMTMKPADIGDGQVSR